MEISSTHPFHEQHNLTFLVPPSSINFLKNIESIFLHHTIYHTFAFKVHAYKSSFPLTISNVFRYMLNFDPSKNNKNTYCQVFVSNMFSFSLCLTCLALVEENKLWVWKQKCIHDILTLSKNMIVYKRP